MLKVTSETDFTDRLTLKKKKNATCMNTKEKYTCIIKSILNDLFLRV